MSEVQNYMNGKTLLIRADFPKVFGIDFRTFEDLYIKASSNQDRKIAKFKIEITKIPREKVVKKLFNKNQVVEFLSLHGIYPLEKLNIKKAPAATEA